MTIYHKHHIIPKHMGGSDDPSNLVSLSIKDHALAHKLLHEKYGKVQDFIAWKTLDGQMTRQEASHLARKYRDTSYMKTPEYRQKVSNSKKGSIPWNKGQTGVQDHTAIRGGNNYGAKPCFYNDAPYSCVRDAMKASGLTKYYLYKDPNFRFDM